MFQPTSCGDSREHQRRLHRHRLACPALPQGADSLTIGDVRPRPAAPCQVASTPSTSERERHGLFPAGGTVLGPPGGAMLLTVLARYIACRWRSGPPPHAADVGRGPRRQAPQDFPIPAVLARRLELALGSRSRAHHRQWHPPRLRDDRTKEKFGTLRWDIQAGRVRGLRRRHRRLPGSPVRLCLRILRRTGISS